MCRTPLLTPRFVTMVRSPVQRTLSEFFWFAREQSCALIWTRAVCLAAREGTKQARQGNVSGLLRWLLMPGNTAGNRMSMMLADVRWAFSSGERVLDALCCGRR